MSTVTEDEIREFVLAELPLVTTLFRKVDLKDDAVLQELFEAEDIADMSERFFAHFSVSHDEFSLNDWYPWKPRSFFTGKNRETRKRPLTLRMFIDSALAGRWLY